METVTKAPFCAAVLATPMKAVVDRKVWPAGKSNQLFLPLPVVGIILGQLGFERASREG